MKKLIWIWILIGIVSFLQAQNYQGSIATTDFTICLTILQDDNATGVPDGWLCQILLPGANGVIDAANTDGTPGGDDLLCDGGGNNFSAFGWDSYWTDIQGQHYGSVQFLWPASGQGAEPCANVGENFYLRIFNASAVGSASKYLNSELWLLAAANGDLFFNTSAHWDYDSQFNWQSLVIPPTNPDPAENPAPADAAEDIAIDTNLTWEYSGTIVPNGYKLYLGTDNPPTNIVNGDDLGDVLTYDPLADFAYSTLYYWQIVPYTSDREKGKERALKQKAKKLDHHRGEAEDCPIWSFTTVDNPLPVSLSSFTAEFADDFPVLHWTTQSENDNLGWNIYRSETPYIGNSDLLNFEIISGAGTTSNPTDYSYYDKHPTLSGITFWYWLENVANNGGTCLMGPISLFIPAYENDIPDLPLVTVLNKNYPNPFNPTTILSFDIREGETGKLSIYNLQGQLVESQTYDAGSYNISWEGSEYGTGVYFYILKTGSYCRINKMLMLK